MVAGGEDAPAPIPVIVNFGAGGRSGRAAVSALRDALERHPGRFSVHAARKGRGLDRAIEEAMDGPSPVIAAAGGDGTVRAVAIKLAGTGRALGVIPMGTFNYFARGLGLPEEPGAAADLILEGEPRAVPVAEVNGRLFLNNASLGLYPAILAQREGVYRRWGRSRLAAHGAVLLTFLRSYRALSMHIAADGDRQTISSPLVFVGRSAFQLRDFGLDGADDAEAGRMAVFIVADCGRWRLLALALRLLGGAMTPGRDFTLFAAREMTITPRRRTRLIAQDGERERVEAPFRFRMLEDALRVMAPPQD